MMSVGPFLFVFGLMVLLCGGASAQTDTIVLERWHFLKQGIVGVYDVEGNFNPGRYKWSILTPSQGPMRGLSNYVDPNQIRPFPKAPGRSKIPKLSNLLYKNCYESDRCELLIPPKESVGEKRLVIRLTGIDTPQVKASCEQETFLGNEAKKLISRYLSSAVHIELRNFYKRGGEIKGHLVADGQDLSELLVNQGLAVPFDGRRKDWCS